MDMCHPIFQKNRAIFMPAVTFTTIKKKKKKVEKINSTEKKLCKKIEKIIFEVICISGLSLFKGVCSFRECYFTFTLGRGSHNRPFQHLFELSYLPFQAGFQGMLVCCFSGVIEIYFCLFLQLLQTK